MNVGKIIAFLLFLVDVFVFSKERLIQNPRRKATEKITKLDGNL